MLGGKASGVARACLIPAARTIDVPSDASRHAGESRYSRLYADGRLNDVDTGFRRHDEIGAAAESIVWAVGIRAFFLTTEQRSVSLMPSQSIAADAWILSINNFAKFCLLPSRIPRTVADTVDVTPSPRICRPAPGIVWQNSHLREFPAISRHITPKSRNLARVLNIG